MAGVLVVRLGRHILAGGVGRTEVARRLRGVAGDVNVRTVGLITGTGRPIKWS